MDPLDEIERLIILDPNGWRVEYGGNHRIERLIYDRITVVTSYFYQSLQSGARTIVVRPGCYELGWWGRRRFDKLCKMLTANIVKDTSRKVAERLIKDRNSEVENAMRELDDDLAAQFVALEEADKKERAKLKDAPVVNGFFKGAIKQLGKGQ